MCGINGIVYLRNSSANKPEEFHFSRIRKMNEEIAHRGPDGEGFFIEYPFVLGHRRLSIIDLSENGNQPMFNEDKSVAIVFNGEIYNYKELIPVLRNKGHVFRSKCDTEVIIHAYEEYGEECVKMFNGMWAFVIVNLKNGKVFASRDRFGVKPFFYTLKNDEFIFSSEIKAILKAQPVFEADKGKVFNYLAYGYRLNDGRTFFESVKELLPGHNLQLEDGNVKTTRYFRLEPDIKSGDVSKEEIRDLVFDSVALRFRSDVPVSILLSGGIDSGIIAAAANMLIETGMIKNYSVTSYSAVFPGFEKDESAAIREILSACKEIQGNFITPSPDGLADSLNDFVYGMGEPVFSSTSLAHYLLMKEIRDRGVKVVLNGQGSDEAWCGYGRYISGYFLLDILMSKPGQFARQFRAIGKKTGLSATFLASQIFKALIPRSTASYLRSRYSENIYNLISPGFANEFKDDFREFKTARASGKNLDEYMRYNIEYQGFNQILHYEDHSSMQHSVEMRSPFIDYRLMELAFSLPIEKKFYDGTTKKNLRESFADLLPESIVSNNRKIGFETPFDRWVAEPVFAKMLSDIFSSDEFINRSIYDNQKISHFGSRKHPPGFPLWRMLNLELWLRQYGITNI